MQLFYSYCHKDANFRESMEKSLAQLKNDGLLQQWSDRQILPGQGISSKVREKIRQADIVAFLFSPDFIASVECRKEWDYVANLAHNGKVVFRIPIILRACAWKDTLNGDDVKALPQDGSPVTGFTDQDTAWLQVYEGIKAVVNELRSTFTPREEFIKEITKTDFISQSHLRLQDLFVFLRMTCTDPQETEPLAWSKAISSQAELLTHKDSLIHGQEKSGKTALARHLYLSLIEESKPVLYVDLTQLITKPDDAFLRKAYGDQFRGEYDLWIQQENKTLVVDNMTAAPRSLDFVDFAKGIFERIVITASSDIFYSFFKDEARLADFSQMKIEPLTRIQQEELIRKRLALSNSGKPVTDGLVDQVEGYVDSIIISGKIVPRFPFYVLSILQIYEAYMPTNMSITSYGHCYYVLIVANLIRSGISNADDSVNACFNFAEHLAFRIYQHREYHADAPFDFEDFAKGYKNQFFIKDSLINRLSHLTYGIIGKDGSFKTPYMYYYFLGKYLSKNSKECESVIDAMCEHSYLEANHLTLLFTIHHSSDSSVIDNILIRTMNTLDSVQPASLTSEETKRFGSILAELPKDILSKDPVEKARKYERAVQDHLDNSQVEDQDASSELDEVSPVNGAYRILKNNKIMGQVLRNKYGDLEKARVEEIIEIIADSGLRLVNLTLKDQEEITSLAIYIKTKRPKWDIPRIKQALELLSFLWTMVNVEQIVDAVNVPEIKEAVNAVVARRSNPAYDLIGYFSHLDSASVTLPPKTVSVRSRVLR